MEKNYLKEMKTINKKKTKGCVLTATLFLPDLDLHLYNDGCAIFKSLLNHG